MNKNKIDQHYSSLFFDLCKNDEAREKVHEDVQYLKTFCQQEAFIAFLRNPLHRQSTQKMVLAHILKPYISLQTWEFLQLLILKRRLGHLKMVLEFFLKRYRAYEKRGRADLTVAHTLTRKAEAAFIHFIKKLTHWEEVKLNVSVDESIIGGYILDLENQQLDLSLRTRLAALQTFWQNNREENLFSREKRNNP